MGSSNTHFFFRFVSRSLALACSRRSESGARTKKKASERAGKKRGETGEEDVSPRFFPLFRSLYFSLALHSLNAWNRLHLPLTSGLRYAKQILVTSSATQARAHILSDVICFAPWGEGEQRRGLLPLGHFLFPIDTILLPFHNEPKLVHSP